ERRQEKVRSVLAYQNCVLNRAALDAKETVVAILRSVPAQERDFRGRALPAAKCQRGGADTLESQNIEDRKKRQLQSLTDGGFLCEVLEHLQEDETAAQVTGVEPRVEREMHRLRRCVLAEIDK